MNQDEQEIRALVATWMSATKAGDVGTVLSLMSDDVVFLVPGHAPMRKADFEAASRAQAGNDGPTFEGSSDIQEIKVLGEWAFMWQKLVVIMTPPGDGAQMKREGHTLTLFQKQQGRWVLARDANLLAPASG